VFETDSTILLLLTLILCEHSFSQSQSDVHSFSQSQRERDEISKRCGGKITSSSDPINLYKGCTFPGMYYNWSSFFIFLLFKLCDVPEWSGRYSFIF